MTVQNVDPSESFYEEGILFDRSFYKNAIADKSKAVSEEDLKVARACETCLEIAKRVTTLALLVFPSAVVFGSFSTLGIFGAGALSGLMVTSAESEFVKRPLNVYEEIDAKARLFVHLDFSHKARYLAQEYFSTTMLKAAFATSLYFMQAWPMVNNAVSLMTISCIGMQYGTELLTGMLSSVEWYYKTYKEKELLEQIKMLPA